jgi:hypothetical protein
MYKHYVYGNSTTISRLRLFLEKLIVPQLAKKFPPFYGPRRFIAMSIKKPPLLPILNQANPIHNLKPYIFKIHFNIIHPLMPTLSA